MEIISKQLTLPKIKYYEMHLNVIKPFIPQEMTPMEIKVLAVFMSLEGDVARDRFGTTARRIVMDETGVSPGGLGNYLKALKTKQFIKELEDGKIEIWPLLYPEEQQQKYMFKISKKS